MLFKDRHYKSITLATVIAMERTLASPFNVADGTTSLMAELERRAFCWLSGRPARDS